MDSGLPMGKMAKDKITGFVGVITGRSEYINGCVHIMLEAKTKPGIKPVHAWFDEDRILLTGKSNVVLVHVLPKKTTITHTHITRSRPGGPMPHSI